MSKILCKWILPSVLSQIIFSWHYTILPKGYFTWLSNKSCCDEQQSKADHNSSFPQFVFVLNSTTDYGLSTLMVTFRARLNQLFIIPQACIEQRYKGPIAHEANVGLHRQGASDATSSAPTIRYYKVVQRIYELLNHFVDFGKHLFGSVRMLRGWTNWFVLGLQECYLILRMLFKNVFELNLSILTEKIHCIHIFRCE